MVPKEEKLLRAVTKLILWVSCWTPVILRSLPLEYIDGNPVPTVVFKGHPSIFHAFVISIILAFTGSFFALRIGYQSRIGKVCGYCCLVSMASAFWLVVYALLASDWLRLDFLWKAWPSFVASL
ncbi:hypothetical protein Tsubulata_050353 [Turnera subulata]|uniref:Uncharacterized protein n=1 Tax=Turnera subulata TaxID=218843 RepID=A0A9Q0FG48_9ROSI|nr:hypothetical protein Tsubulata_050353 [Turnera subulata]